jgi:hypothetical protein
MYYDGGFSAGNQACYPLHFIIMFSSTIIGYVTDLKVLKSREDDSYFLAISIAVNDPFGGSCRLRFTNSNGLLAAYNKGTLVPGHQLILTQWNVRISTIKTHYQKDGQMVTLKYPEIKLTGVRATIGAAPKPKTSAALTQPEEEDYLDF